MLHVEEWMDIKDLHRQGHSIRAIAEMTGYSRNTVRRLLRQTSVPVFQKPVRPSKLEAFKSYVEKRYTECRLSAVRLQEEIRPMGYTGSVDVVRRFVRTLASAKPSLDRVTVRFETPPGRQAQVDWGYCGRFPDDQGRPVSVYVFVMVLSFSRAMYVQFTTSMKVPMLMDCHQRAFEFFGGWPQSILYDNMKQVKLNLEQWNPLFMDFAAHYGLTVKTHRIRRPRTKGKVERMVHYVKDNFLNGRTFVDLADLNAQGHHWLTETANVRIHATTGQRPVDLWPQEGLTALGTVAPYSLCEWAPRKVDWEGFVRFDRSRYSVPPEHAGQSVTVQLREQKIRIRAGSLIIAEHPVAPRPGSCMAEKAHIDALWKLSLQQRPAAVPDWTVTFQDTVVTTPLGVYEEVVQ